MQESFWLKPKRGNNAKHLILSFRSDFPSFIDIPGETARTQVIIITKEPAIINVLKVGMNRKLYRSSQNQECRNFKPGSFRLRKTKFSGLFPTKDMQTPAPSPQFRSGFHG